MENCSKISLPGKYILQNTFGRYLARRLIQIGVHDVFSVPGDFNLMLLDHIVADPDLNLIGDDPDFNLIGCRNELNADYPADGYARGCDVGACVVTFTVGGLSVINAIAGPYSENLTVICIVGGPNSNDFIRNKVLHHTIGLPDFSQELRFFQTVTCFQAVVNNFDDSMELINTAISMALRESKPVYINISCNLPGLQHPTFIINTVPYYLEPISSNQIGLEAAVDAAAEFLNKSPDQAIKLINLVVLLQVRTEEELDIHTPFLFDQSHDQSQKR